VLHFLILGRSTDKFGGSKYSIARSFRIHCEGAKGAKGAQNYRGKSS
jgi:hypothetical protein